MCANEISQPEKAPPTSRRIVAIASAVYALRFLAMAAYYPYVFLWLESNGFDTHERGLLGGINGLTRVLAPTALGALADWTGRRKLIFVTGSLVNAVAVAALPLVPRSFLAQAALLVVGSLSEQTSLVDAFVQRSLAWAGLAGSQPTARAFGALTWAAAAPIFGELVQLFGLSFLFRLYGVLVACVAMPIVLALPISAAYAHTDSLHSGDTGDAGEATPEAGTSSTTTAAAVASAAPPPLSFARRLRAAVCGEGAASSRLRFCMLLITMVGFQVRQHAHTHIPTHLHLCRPAPVIPCPQQRKRDLGHHTHRRWASASPSASSTSSVASTRPASSSASRSPSKPPSRCRCSARPTGWSAPSVGCAPRSSQRPSPAPSDGLAGGRRRRRSRLCRSRRGMAGRLRSRSRASAWWPTTSPSPGCRRRWWASSTRRSPSATSSPPSAGESS